MEKNMLSFLYIIMFSQCEEQRGKVVSMEEKV